MTPPRVRPTDGWNGARPDWVHELLDDIAALVGAPALVEDAEHVVVAYSRHDDPGDEVRATTILGRRASQDVGTWLADLGIARATAATRVPGNPALGMKPRVCVPLRRGEGLVGYLWFIDADMEMSPFDLERAEQAGAALVEVLWHDLPPGDLGSSRTLRALLAGELPADPRVERLEEARARTGAGLVVLAVATREADPASLRLRQALSALAAHLAGQASLAAVVDDLGTVVCLEPCDSPDLSTLVRQALPGDASDLAVGIGDPVPDVPSLPRALDTALAALACSVEWPARGPVLSWRDAGMHRLVPHLLEDADGPARALVERLRAMAASPDQEHLVRTVEVYLDLAGHAQATAAALVLHRTTLYQRLQRFTELTGVDLRDGEARTLVHVALKAARLPHA